MRQKSIETDDITLVVGDAHMDPSQHNKKGLRRFRALGRYLKHLRPRRIVLIGDFATCDSLSHWDKDKRLKIEGRRYRLDIESANGALSETRKYAGGQVWDAMERVYVEGNHENWIEQYVDRNPEVQGILSIKKDVADKFGFKWVPYKSDWTYKGVSFTHVPINEAGKPIGGANAAAKALAIYHNSVVWGHSHKLDLACVARHNSPHLNQAINVGCFFEHVDDYARGSVTSYWRGLVALNHYSHNRVDVNTFSLKHLLEVYGDDEEE